MCDLLHFLLTIMNRVNKTVSNAYNFSRFYMFQDHLNVSTTAVILKAVVIASPKTSI